MRKPDFCLCENKGADQLRSNCEADQRLCFRYSDSTIPPLLNPKSQASNLFLGLHRPVYVRRGRKPRRPVFLRRGSIFILLQYFYVFSSSSRQCHGENPTVRTLKVCRLYVFLVSLQKVSGVGTYTEFRSQRNSSLNFK